MREIDICFGEAKTAVAAMRRAHGVQPTGSTASALSSAQTQLDRLQRDYSAAKKSYGAVGGGQSDRSALLGGQSSAAASSMASSVSALSANQRTALLADGQRVAGTTQRLNNTHRVAAETEQVGANVLTALEGQNEQLLRAGATVDQVDEDLGAARGVLRSMARRVVTNKLLLILIVVVQLAAIMIVVWARWLRRAHHGDAPTPHPTPAPTPQPTPQPTVTPNPTTMMMDLILS